MSRDRAPLTLRKQILSFYQKSVLNRMTNLFFSEICEGVESTLKIECHVVPLPYIDITA